MALFAAQQGIVLHSREILKDQRFQALIRSINPSDIELHVPLENLEVPMGTSLTVEFWDKNSTYEFETHAVQTKELVGKSLYIEKPQEIRKLVNRGYARVRIRLDCRYEHWERPGLIRALLLDISGGGAMLSGTSAFKQGDMLKLSFDLPNGELFENVGCTVMWARKVQENVYVGGVQFATISEIRREKISRFVSHIIETKGAARG